MSFSLDDECLLRRPAASFLFGMTIGSCTAGYRPGTMIMSSRHSLPCHVVLGSPIPSFVSSRLLYIAGLPGQPSAAWVGVVVGMSEPNLPGHCR